MPQFSVDKYNKLLRINEAHSELCKQLDSAGASLQELLSHPDILKLFMHGDCAYQYGICILHHHYRLEDGERMVSAGKDDTLHTPISMMLTQPSFDKSPKICTDRWMPNGNEFEHTITTDGELISPPPPEFFTQFCRICAKFHVDILGICAANMEVMPSKDQIFLEEPFGDVKNRTQKTTLVWRKDVDNLKSWESAWLPLCLKLSSAGDGVDNELLSMLSCVHNCTGHLLDATKKAVIGENVLFKGDMQTSD